MNINSVVSKSYNIRQEKRPKFWHLAKSMEFNERVESINKDLREIKIDEIISVSNVGNIS